MIGFTPGELLFLSSQRSTTSLRGWIPVVGIPVLRACLFVWMRKIRRTDPAGNGEDLLTSL